MSRIGKLPIEVPKGIDIKITGDIVSVKGPLGTLEQKIDPRIKVKLDGTQMVFERGTDHKDERSLHGLYRSLVSNMVHGVSKGYTLQQELVGVGYKATNQGQMLELTLGYSHNIIFEIPKEIKVKTLTEKGKNPTIILDSMDKQLLGQVAAKIRSLRKPEPYKGKGIRFTGEQVRRKAGKSAGK